MLHLYHLSKAKKKKEVMFIDTLAYIAGFASPLMSIPQLYGIWVQKSVAGVSVISWASFALFSLVFATYGYINKEKLIMLNSSIWFVMQSLITIGVLLYR